MHVVRRSPSSPAPRTPGGVSVSVCGVVNGRFTASGLGFQYFESLQAARQVFPDLDPDADTARFTRAFAYPDGRHLRFETHTARAFYAG